uniref:NADH-ubiquinone oxidoreductase chain 5 n=1 Tax=Dosinia altior TaxID=2184472 RepID=A0A2S1U275_9BIVA|nr:NADH dehydrogenase subunit 5 [Dosinia altior]AWI67995.1 NADH dehydrogenase subunit 5 [Dosinia altior]
MVMLVNNFLVVVTAAVSLLSFMMFWWMYLLKSVKDGILLVLEWEFSDKMVMEFSFPLILDIVSCMFMITVLFISGSVMFFTGFYMSHEKFMARFVILVLLFVVSMVLLVLFPSYLSLMLGWDGLGVVSFLLVVYYMNDDSLSAGMITAISNRVGDVFFIMVIAMMSCMMSFLVMSKMFLYFGLMGLLVLFGSMTKSAQIPFSAWLPEAMAAPTPVSTLVHSSTLVTAGVYVLVRFNVLLGEMSFYVLLFLSMMTIIMAGSSAVLEVDMKKVVALSTLSQVGMMMFSISIGAVKVAFFHLVVHAFFKALMFMCVGGVIFYSGGIQDARFLSGLWVKMPLTCVLLLFTNLSLMGFPFMSGFYSKELILGIFLLGDYCLIGFLLLFISLVLTICYSIRMMVLMMKYEEVSAFEHYSVNNIFYFIALVLMMHGAVSVGLVIQLLSKSLVFSVVIVPKVLYGCLVFTLLWFLNFMMLIGVSKSTVIKDLMKSMVSGMWFLKPLSGNLISSNVLVKLSTFVSLVEMGWVRGYIWSGGLKEMMFNKSKDLRKLNFNLIGLVSFFCVFMCIVVLL